MDNKMGRRLSLCGLSLSLIIAAPARAIPVFDASVFAQQLVTAIEAVDQTLGQIEDYKMQILQAQQMVRDGVADIVYTWDRLESIHDQVTNLDRELERFMDELHDWVGALKTREYYRTSPCYGSDLKCYRGQWQRVIANYKDWQFHNTESQRATLALVAKTLGLERQKLRETRRNLDDLRRQAETADGQWKAMQAGNMLTAHLASHLQALRELMSSQHQVFLAQWAAQLERQAQHDAARERIYHPMATITPERRLALWPER